MAHRHLTTITMFALLLATLPALAQSAKPTAKPSAADIRKEFYREYAMELLKLGFHNSNGFVQDDETGVGDTELAILLPYANDV